MESSSEACAAHGQSVRRTTRRRFLKASLALGAAALLPSSKGDRAESAAFGAEKPEFPPGRYVDMHTHVGQTWNTTEYLSAEKLLGWMDANDIAQAIVLPLVSPESSSYLLTSEFVLAETKPHRERLVPFCCIDPRTSFSGGLKGLVAMLKRWIDLGAKGFGEHKTGIRIDDPRNMLVYAACSELKLPLLFHLDEQRNMDAPGLPGLEKALAEFPGTTFIGHGPGWWASISGDVKDADLAKYPSGPVAPGGAIDKLMEKYPNLYGDLSAGSGAGSISRDLAFGREFLIRRADRLMFGTDFLSPGQEVPQLTLFRKLELPAEVQAKVFRDNARRILGLTATA